LDWEKFRDFVKSHADKKPVEIAELWHEEISDRTISRALKKLALREKKDLWLS
jgi:ribosomal protein L31E